MISRVAFAIAILALAPSCSDAVRASPPTRKTHAHPPVLCTPAPGIPASDHPPMVWHATASLFHCFLRPKPVACAPASTFVSTPCCLSPLLHLFTPQRYSSPTSILIFSTHSFLPSICPAPLLQFTVPSSGAVLRRSLAPSSSAIAAPLRSLVAKPSSSSSRRAHIAVG